MGRINCNILSELLEPDSFQVFLMTSSIPYPFAFAVHSWFVTNRKGEVHRYEFGKFKNSPHQGGIGLLKDFLKPTTGMNRLPWSGEWRFPSRLIGMVSGDQYSEAARLSSFLENRSEYYPHKHRYSYRGPNSNTYVGWVLKHFPDSGLTLPSSAIGKDFYAQAVTRTLKKKIRYVNLSHDS